MSSKTKKLSAAEQTAIAKDVLGDLEGPKLPLPQPPAAPSTMSQSNLDRFLAYEQEMAKAWATVERNGRLDLRSVEWLMYVALRVFIECLKVIVRDKLYREEGYSSLEDYMEVRWARTRKWAYDQLCWLEAVEYLEGKGVTNPLQNLSIDAAQVFRQWRNRPEVFYLAYMRVVERGEEPTKEKLTQEGEIQREYLLEADRIPELTHDEFRAYQRLNGLPQSYNLDADSADTLIGRCRVEKQRPSLQALTKVARRANALNFA